MSQKKGWHFLQILPHFAGVKSNEVFCTGSYYFQIYFSSICWKAILSLPDWLPVYILTRVPKTRSLTAGQRNKANLEMKSFWASFSIVKLIFRAYFMLNMLHTNLYCWWNPAMAISWYGEHDFIGFHGTYLLCKFEIEVIQLYSILE